ncbi:MAG TPA: helix-turn-helix transcriptional regulator [Thermoanaerobaculia bacterium]|jgi:transcriptional regulator with XRE-family HTH domain|nr:helix-turn-helix transcriptional regulator [Thermoanaerobaculia bacterium]
MTDLGTALAILRLVRGWSQENLAKVCGLRSGTISDYERGKLVPGLTTAKKILAAEGYSWAAVELAQDFILKVRAESFESSSSAGQAGAAPSAPQREIQDVATMAGSVVSRIVRLMLAAPPSRDPSSREGEKGSD